MISRQTLSTNQGMEGLRGRMRGAAVPMAVVLVVLAAGCFAGRADAQERNAPWRIIFISSSRSQGYLGVFFRDITQDQVSALKLKENRGVEVVMIDHDGPACKAGLKEHDVILQMDGQAVDGEEQFRHMLHELAPGRKVWLQISRDGQVQSMQVTLANRSEIERNAWSQHFVVPDPGMEQQSSQKQENAFSRLGDKLLPNPAVILGIPRIGVTLDPMEPQLAEFFGAPKGKGLLVRSVDANSVAEHAGLKAGDVVLKVNGTVVASRNDWQRALHEGRAKPVAVTILREKKEQTLTVHVDEKRKGEVDEPVVRPTMMFRLVS